MTSKLPAHWDNKTDGRHHAAPHGGHRPAKRQPPAGRSCRRALAYPPRSRPVPAAAACHISVDDHMTQAGEYDPDAPQTKPALPPGFGRRAYLDDLSTPPTGGSLPQRALNRPGPGTFGKRSWEPAVTRPGAVCAAGSHGYLV